MIMIFNRTNNMKIFNDNIQPSTPLNNQTNNDNDQNKKSDEEDFDTNIFFNPQAFTNTNEETNNNLSNNFNHENKNHFNNNNHNILIDNNNPKRNAQGEKQDNTCSHKPPNIGPITKKPIKTWAFVNDTAAAQHNNLKVRKKKNKIYLKNGDKSTTIIIGVGGNVASLNLQQFRPNHNGNHNSNKSNKNKEGSWHFTNVIFLPSSNNDNNNVTQFNKSNKSCNISPKT